MENIVTGQNRWFLHSKLFYQLLRVRPSWAQPTNFPLQSSPTSLWRKSCNWLVVEPPLWKNMSSSVGMIVPNIWRFPLLGVPKMDGLQWENPIRMDDFAVPCGTPISGSLPNMGARYITKTKFYCLQPLSQLWWLFLMRDFWPDAMWGFPQMGVPAVIIHL